MHRSEIGLNAPDRRADSTPRERKARNDSDEFSKGNGDP